MQQLTAEILNELRLSIFDEDASSSNKAKNTVVLYSGDFQPFTIENQKEYQWLVNKFGRESVFVIMTNDVNDSTKKLPIEVKKKIVAGFKDIKYQNVKTVKKLYDAKEIFADLDPSDTAIIYALSNDSSLETSIMMANRRVMRFNKTTRMPFKDHDNPYVYIMHIPKVRIKLSSGELLSAESTMKFLSDRTVKLSVLKERFMEVFGWFDANVFNSIMSVINSDRAKLKEESEGKSSLTAIKNISKEQFKKIVSAMKTQYGDAKAVMPIIYKWIKHGSITDDEREQFKKSFVDTLKLVGLGTIAAAPMPASELLIPLIVKLGKKYGINVLPSSFDSTENTAVRKLHTITEGILTSREMYPFVDQNISFGEIKQWMISGLDANMTIQTYGPSSPIVTKFHLTMRGKNVFVATNKFEIKKGGITIAQYVKSFPRTDEFVFACYEIRDLLMRMSEARRGQTFNDGTTWLVMEITAIRTDEMIDYDGLKISVGASETFNDTGELTNRVTTVPSHITALVKDVMRNTSKVFQVKPPQIMMSRKSPKFQARVPQFTNALNVFMSKMSCRDTDTLITWNERWWRKFIQSKVRNLVDTLHPMDLDILLNRWVRGDKTQQLKNLSDQSVKEWATRYEQQELEQQQKKNVVPLERIVIDVGREMAVNLDAFLSVNQTSKVLRLSRELETVIRKLSSTKNVGDLKLVVDFFKKIQSIGGIKAIIPTTGIIYKLGGVKSKLSGTFPNLIDVMGLLIK